jgi:hypothetical protein
LFCFFHGERRATSSKFIIMRLNAIAVALLVSLVGASSLERRNLVPRLRLVPGHAGNVEGEADATSLAKLPASEIPGKVDQATTAAHTQALLLTGYGPKNIMAGLYVPEKHKIYFGAIPRASLNKDMKANPGAYSLSADDVKPMPHAEQHAYSKAKADGAEPGAGSYMSARGNYGDGRECVECCQGKCEPWLTSKNIGGNGRMTNRSGAPSPQPPSPPHQKRRAVAVPEDSILARHVDSLVARAETLLNEREEELTKRSARLDSWESDLVRRGESLMMGSTPSEDEMMAY